MANPNSSYLAPFPKAPISGYDFGDRVPAGGWIGNGQDFGWPVHLGTDFGTLAGETIVASAAATTKFETGLPGYGNRLTETFDNGWSLIFGHVAGGATGKVAAGQPIGVTGKNVGSAQGAVTLVELRNPKGQAVNPDAFIQSLAPGGGSWHPAAGIDTGAAQTDFGNLVNFSGPGGLSLSVGNPLTPLAGLPQALAAIPQSISAVPTQIGHGLADFFATSESNIAEWLKRQTVAFFVAAVVLLVLFL